MLLSGVAHGLILTAIAAAALTASPCSRNDETGSPVTWGEHATDEQYGAAPSSTS